MNSIKFNTIIQRIDNNLWIKREDLIPFSFGGNKARKAALFFDDFDKGDYDCVVTYGSCSSNHCRIVANIAASKKIKCVIISPTEDKKETSNATLMQMFGADVRFVPLSSVHESIEKVLKELQSDGLKPFFIQGGGHGKLGTQAYVDCYNEIKEFEKNNSVFFDYIFLASGTGTTQAGLVVGQILNKDFDRKIVGISIARQNPRGRDVVIESIKEYLGKQYSDDLINKHSFFIDTYISGGYGKTNESINDEINNTMIKNGIPLDPTYTGKAFYGMKQYIKENNIQNKNILFIHTGGAPLFFDYLKTRNK